MGRPRRASCARSSTCTSATSSPTSGAASSTSPSGTRTCGSTHAGTPIYDPAAVDLSRRRPHPPVHAGRPRRGPARLPRPPPASSTCGACSPPPRWPPPTPRSTAWPRLARPGDDQSWWATDADGVDAAVPARLRHAAQRRCSPTSSRTSAPRGSGGCSATTVACAPDRMEGSARRAQGARSDRRARQHPVAPGLRDGRPRRALPEHRRRHPAHRLVRRDRHAHGGAGQPRPDAAVHLGAAVRGRPDPRDRDRAGRRHRAHRRRDARLARAHRRRWPPHALRHLLPAGAVGPASAEGEAFNDVIRNRTTDAAALRRAYPLPTVSAPVDARCDPHPACVDRAQRQHTGCGGRGLRRTSRGRRESAGHP